LNQSPKFAWGIFFVHRFAATSTTLEVPPAPMPRPSDQKTLLLRTAH
jgi:hypothetical protein